MSTRAGSTCEATAELLTPAGALPTPLDPEPTPLDDPEPALDDPEPKGSDPKPDDPEPEPNGPSPAPEDPDPSPEDPGDRLEPSARDPPPLALTKRSTCAPAEPEIATTAAAPAATKTQRRVRRGRALVDRSSVSA
jgi:hypothetical protein